MLAEQVRRPLEKLWLIAEPDPESVLAIASALNISQAAAKLFVVRGHDTPEAALEFINADLDCLENPYKLADMEKAVIRMRMAVSRKEKVFVAGDRDCDGVTSTSLLMNLMKTLGLDAAWSVPSPEEGYGLSRAAIDKASAYGASLLIAVDCGIRDFDGVAYARERSLDVIILDHHEPGECLPAAWAVIDPKRSDCAYPFKDLSACGVAFKFAQAMLMSEDAEFYGREIVVFDVETTGMVASRDRIVELAAIKARNGVETARFESFIRQDRPIPAEVMAIHGITDAMVADAPSEEQVIGKFLEFIGDATLVAHRASFDVGFLTDAAKRLFDRKIKNAVIDTLGEARAEFVGTGHSLGALSTKLRITHDAKHRALSDVLATFALYRRLVAKRNARASAFLRAQLDLVALSTLADVVPLHHENRVLVKRGLEAFKKSARPGIVALREALIRGNTLTGKDLAWSITPVINSAGRLGKAYLAVQLLLAEDDATARKFVAELAVMNTERKERVRTNTEAVVAMMEESFDPVVDSIVVVCVPALEHGVTGIVANRVMHDVGRPVVILIDDGNGIAAGTSRSIDGFDITAAFEKLSHLLERFGGHSGAAGLAIKIENIPLLKEELSEIVRREVAPENLRPKIRIDAVIDAADICEKLVDEMAMLEPTGHGNEAAIFCVRGAEVAEARRMGNNSQHMKLSLRAGACSFEAVAWNIDIEATPNAGERVDVAFSIERNEWQGRARIQCLIEDFRRVA